MRALYSLLSYGRTLYALGQAAVTFVRTGPSGLAPAQLLVLSCGVCILLTLVILSVLPVSNRRGVFLDSLCGVVAAGAVVGLAATDVVGSCVFLGRIMFGG